VEKDGVNLAAYFAWSEWVGPGGGVGISMLFSDLVRVFWES